VTITTRVTLRGTAVGHQFVLECEHNANTNGLGKVQRAIVNYLGTAPADLSMAARSRLIGDTCNAWLVARGYPGDDDVHALWHGQPYGVTVPKIAMAVYGTSEPTPSQIRVVQRNVRRLEQLDLVCCWQACLGFVARPYTQWNGKPSIMPQPVAALAVTFKWNCQHFAEQDRLAAEWTAERVRQMGTVDPIRALQGLV
jgi:hypothetical protein